LLPAGWRSSPGLVGGISILYLSGYASFNYALVSQPVAFILMGVVTVVALPGLPV
jgi:uncharacterized membrane protein